MHRLTEGLTDGRAERLTDGLIEGLTERLTNGWDELVDQDDSLMRRFVHHHADTMSAFCAASGGNVDDVREARLADARRPAGLWNSATVVRPVDDWQALVDAVARAGEGGIGDLHLWSCFPTPDLRGFGWELMGHPPLLARPPLGLMPAAGELAIEPEEVLTPAQLSEWEDVVIDGYPLPETGDVRGTVGPPAILADPRVRCWLGRDDAGRAVSVGTSFVSHGLGSFALGVTLPVARGGGHWRAHAITRLRAAPQIWAAGIFSDHSRPLAERLGFLPLTRFTLWRLPRR